MEINTTNPTHVPTTERMGIQAKEDCLFSNEHIFKALCCVRGDMKDPRFDFDSDATYAPMASHNSIRKFLSIVVSNQLIVEGWYSKCLFVRKD